MKTKQVAVIHAAFSDENAPRTVAFVKVPAEFSDEMAMEYAFKRTNNIEGSWSKGPTFEWEGEVVENPDFSEDVTVMAELPVGKDGNVYGLRSTSMGDMMLVGNKKYKVAAFGFKEMV